MSTRDCVRSWLPALVGVRMLASLWGGLVAVDVAREAPQPAVILLVAVIVAWLSLGQQAVVALVLGGIGWLVVTGFVVNDFGALAVTGWSDAGRLAVLLAAAELGSVGGRRLGGIRAPRRREEPSLLGSRSLAHIGPAGVGHPGER